MKNLMSISWNVLLFILIMVMMQCNESNTPKNGGDSRIYGIWNWNKTAGGEAYREFVPPPAIFVTIKDNGTCSFYRNDTLISERNYKVTREKIYLSDTQNIITFSNIASDSTMGYKHLPGMGQKYYEITDSTLVIGDLGNDMFSYFYSKKR
jgi:hypothetical protein